MKYRFHIFALEIHSYNPFNVVEGSRLTSLLLPCLLLTKFTLYIGIAPVDFVSGQRCYPLVVEPKNETMLIKALVNYIDLYCGTQESNNAHQCFASIA